MHQVCRQWPQRALCMLLFGLGQGLKRTSSRFLLFAVDYQHISFSQHQVEEEEEECNSKHYVQILMMITRTVQNRKKKTKL